MAQQAHWDIVTGVGITALMVAAGRAIETHRPDPLVTDPYAEAFVHAAALPVPMPTRAGTVPDPKSPLNWNALATYSGVRSRFFDEFFSSTSNSGIDQVVLLAAGLDTRAYRLQWNAGTTVYELDAPKVLEFKDRVLADQGARPQCRRQIVGCDLREDWCSALQQMGFDSSRPTAWLAEGLLPFLSDEAQDNLFTQVHQLSVTNSQIAAECLSVNLAALSRQPIFENMAQEFGIDIPESQPDGRRYDPEAGLVNRGWTASTSPASSVAENYHRPLDGTIPLLELFRSNLLLTANL